MFYFSSRDRLSFFGTVGYLRMSNITAVRHARLNLHYEALFKTFSMQFGCASPELGVLELSVPKNKSLLPIAKIPPPQQSLFEKM